VGTSLGPACYTASRGEAGVLTRYEEHVHSMWQSGRGGEVLSPEEKPQMCMQRRSTSRRRRRNAPPVLWAPPDGRPSMAGCLRLRLRHRSIFGFPGEGPSEGLAVHTPSPPSLLPGTSLLEAHAAWELQHAEVMADGPPTQETGGPPSHTRHT
jgi:hypothetical protein